MYNVQCQGCGAWFLEEYKPIPNGEDFCSACEAAQWRALEKMADENKSSP